MLVYVFNCFPQNGQYRKSFNSSFPKLGHLNVIAIAAVAALGGGRAGGRNIVFHTSNNKSCDASV